MVMGKCEVLYLVQGYFGGSPDECDCNENVLCSWGNHNDGRETGRGFLSMLFQIKRNFWISE